MAKKIVTLYIDDTSLRLMVTSGTRIRKSAELPLEMSLAKVSANIKETEITTKVKQLLKSQKVRTKKIIVGLSGLHCLTRPITFPQLPRAMLDEAVIREAKRLLPIPLEQLYLSWQIIPAPEGKTQVFLVAIPCQTADTLLKILLKVGLKPYLMELKPLALARLVPEATAITVDTQPNEFDIVILTDGVPQPIRTVSFPSEALSLQDRLLLVRDELNRTIEFYNSNNPKNPLTTDTTVYVSGELADEPELCKALSNELGYPVLPLQSPLKCPKQFDPTRYMVNIGLALKELEGKAGPLVANVNALPVPYRPLSTSITRIAIIPSIVIIIGLLALLMILIQEASDNINTTSDRLATTNQLLVKKQTEKKELTQNIADLQKKLAQAEASRDTFTSARASLDREDKVMNGDLAETMNSLLSTVILTDINHAGNKLTLQGGAPSEVEILSYARNLDGSGRFPEVTISNIKRVGSEESTGQEGAAQDGTGGESIGEEGTSEEGATEEGAGEEGAGEEGTSEEGASEEGASEEGASEEGAAEEGMDFTLILKTGGQG